tara:strand:- start:775 stop:1167 length:393 start_codon:yes stop_codon:yes gene_type:complete
MLTSKKVILGCFQHGADGYKNALCGLVEQRLTIPTIGVRWHMLGQGMEVEINHGMKMTRGPTCSARVKRELGLKRISKQKTLDLWLHMMDIVDLSIQSGQVVYEGVQIMTWVNAPDCPNEFDALPNGGRV